MKFKSRTFLRNFGVLVLLLGVVYTSFFLFIINGNLKNELTEARNGLVVIILPGLLVLVVGGLVIYGIARITDIEARQAEKALQESEEKYRSLANQVPVGIYRTSEEGQILYANPALAAMLGYDSVEELLKVPVQHTFVNPNQRTDYLMRWKKNKGVLTIENKLLTRDRKEIWVRDTGKAVAGENGDIVYFDGIVEDVTESKQAEEERQKLEEQLRQALKMEAIGTLAGGIAHDFNNILGVIIGYSEMTLENIPGDDPNRAYMEKVLIACQRARDLVKHILTFSRKTEKERKPVLLNEIVNESLKLLRSALPTTIEIRQHIPGEFGPILANWTEIHQVIMNLCTNAAHAMSEQGGTLEILLKEIHLDPRDIGVKNLQPGRYQQLTISDTGHGMIPEVMNRIFEPYFTTKAKGEGTGMGLALAHGIIKSHGGEITVYSEPGKGTVFHIYFPVTEIEKISEVEVKEEIQGGNEHILFVDDEETLVELAQQMLESLGYTVTARTSAIEALEAFSSAPHRFALVITDQIMPNLTGLQLSGKLRQIRSDIPIILCTGFSESVKEETIKTHRINAFVLKPLLKKDIARAIRTILD
ncbi:MAG: PAS domain S-box protein [Candidatus Aminicenantes bacterium]|nr:MAG: PAS domain S-box protein [Candidatus Aminicenantes bacterium]